MKVGIMILALITSKKKAMKGWVLLLACNRCLNMLQMIKGGEIYGQALLL